MKTFEFSAEIELPRPLDEVFEFFSNAANLELLTPDFLNFRILTEQPVEMREGALIEYQLRVHGIPLRWQSRINVWDPPHCFVDEQLKGPYRQWIHRHTFEATKNGTLCRDHVRYAVPGGELVNRFIVRPDIERIFKHRQSRMAELFPAPTVSTAADAVAA